MSLSARRFSVGRRARYLCRPRSMGYTAQPDLPTATSLLGCRVFQLLLLRKKSSLAKNDRPVGTAGLRNIGTH